MTQTIRLTIGPDLEKALSILRQSTLGTLNTTELIKMAVGGFAKMKSVDLSPQEVDMLSASSFHQWAVEDGSNEMNNIAHIKKLKPYTPKKHVRTR